MEATGEGNGVVPGSGEERVAAEMRGGGGGWAAVEMGGGGGLGGWTAAEMGGGLVDMGVSELLSYGGDFRTNWRRSSLRELENEQKLCAEINARQETRIENLQSKVNELIGFYLVFQGVVLTSVAQGSMLRCHNWWLPFALSCIAAFAIILAVLHLLLKLARCKAELEQNHAAADKLKHHIMRYKIRIRATAVACPAVAAALSSDDIVIPFDAAEDPQQMGLPPLSLSRILYRLIYPTVVLIILLAFTAFILVSCRRILCFPGAKPKEDEPNTT